MTTKTATANAYVYIQLDNPLKGQALTTHDITGEYELPLRIYSKDAQRLMALTEKYGNHTPEEEDEFIRIQEQIFTDMDCLPEQTFCDPAHRLFYQWHRDEDNVCEKEVWPVEVVK